jgi:hypothetical protein
MVMQGGPKSKVHFTITWVSGKRFRRSILSLIGYLLPFKIRHRTLISVSGNQSYKKFILFLADPAYGRTINLCIKFDRVLIKACFISHFKGHQMAFLTRYRTLESVYRNTSYEKVSIFLAYSINQNFFTFCIV